MTVKENKSNDDSCTNKERLQTKKTVMITNSSITEFTAVLTEQDNDGIDVHIYKISISLDPLKDNNQNTIFAMGEHRCVVASHIKKTKKHKKTDKKSK